MMLFSNASADAEAEQQQQLNKSMAVSVTKPQVCVPRSRANTPSETSCDDSSASSGEPLTGERLYGEIAEMGSFRHYPHAYAAKLDERLWERFVRSTKKRLNKARVHEVFYPEEHKLTADAKQQQQRLQAQQQLRSSSSSMPNDATSKTTPINSSGNTDTGSSNSNSNSTEQKLQKPKRKLQHFPPLPGSILRIPHTDIAVGRLLGEGSFAAVYEVTSLGHVSTKKFRWVRKLMPNGLKKGKSKSSLLSPSSSNSSSSANKHTLKLEQKLHDDHHQQSDIVVKLLKHGLVDKPSLMAACAADMAKEAMILNFLHRQAQLQDDSQSNPKYVKKDNNCHIVQMYAWSNCGLDGYATGRHDSFFVVLERLQETLARRIVDWKVSVGSNRYLVSTLNNLFWRERILVIEQIAQALQHLHRHRIIHRDIKPDNVGFDKQNRVKVFDLDVCRILPDESKALTGEDSEAMDVDNSDSVRRRTNINSRGQLFKLTKKVGSPRYMSPECARGDPYNQQTDIYSLALVMHEVMSLQKPFENVSASDHTKLVVNGGSRPQFTSLWSPEMCVLVKEMWQNDALRRPHISDIISRLRAEAESY